MMESTMPERARIARRRFILSTAGLYSLALFGCSLQLPGSGKAARRVRLSAAESFPPNLPSVAWTLQVREPTATQSLNTAKIAIGDLKDIKYLANGEWASRAPEMIMELLVRSFKNSNRILTVGDRRARIRPDFVLDLRIVQFQVEKTAEGSGTVRVAMEATLVKRPRRDALSSISFSSMAKAQPLSLDNIVTAFDESLRDVMEQLVEWTLQTGANA